MCGICGIHAPDGDVDDRRQRVSRMTRAMTHRGPDDDGRFEDDDISLGFRRLAVIDLETGQQPIRLEDDRAVIVLNGEIYNYRELREELEPRHRFRSRGDVEVVLRLYAEDGIEALRRLDGMFALALWDRETRTLYLARDRFGIKPLFFCREGGSLAFASEFGTLLEGGFPSSATIDRRELRHYLFQKYLSPCGAILKGVDSLAPGTVLEVGPRGERRFRFWDPPESPDSKMTDDEAVRAVSGLLRDAVRKQLVADVPVGVFLSGGVDSSTVASLVKASERGAVRTFSVGFDSADVVDELPRAARVARQLGTEHHELVMNPARVAEDLPAILGALDGPLGDATVVPTWYMSRFARRTVTVALSGEGADELFGGYDRLRFDAWMDRIGQVGRRVLPRMLALAGRTPSTRLRRRLLMPAGLERQLDWSRVFLSDDIDGLTTEPLAGEADVLATHRELAERWQRRARVDPLNARLETDRELFLVGDLLPKVDRMSMAHSLEVRVPFLDNALSEFVLAQPGHRKIRGRVVKWLLRRAAMPFVPESGATERKQGFDVPVSAWLRGALREPLTDFLSHDVVRRRGLFRPERVTAMVRQHLEGDADHGEKLWLLLALEGWMQGSLDRGTPSVSRVRR